MWETPRGGGGQKKSSGSYESEKKSIDEGGEGSKEIRTFCRGNYTPRLRKREKRNKKTRQRRRGSPGGEGRLS